MAAQKTAKPRRTFIKKKATASVAAEKSTASVKEDATVSTPEPIIVPDETDTTPTPEIVIPTETPSTPTIAEPETPAAEEESKPAVVEETATPSETTETPSTDTASETTTVTVVAPETTTEESTPAVVVAESPTPTQPIEMSAPTDVVTESLGSMTSPSTKSSASDSFSVEGNGRKKLLWILGPILVIVLLFGAGFGISKFMDKKPVTTKSSSTETAATPTATPTPEEVDVAKFTVKILNGSGISGEASKASDLLTAADFNVDDLGNAKKFDYTETLIQAKKSVPESVITTLKTTLGKKYVVGDNETLTSSETVDIIVIVGSKKAE